jgi:hypothetical protein
MAASARGLVEEAGGDVEMTADELHHHLAIAVWRFGTVAANLSSPPIN